ncbi:putative Ig domain-containing protein [Actinocrinis sp.]|uniref:putative Ig domain-containing protein n=1 Tax=Actinocrinis sp. TaxID=1920516 RepID=UPI002D529DF8|nr:putative Ig domain-containing protein [Actinocrinis sp.]HZP53401.1 putative Ig domain-containing protein [Actinocrinis sp.]
MGVVVTFDGGENAVEVQPGAQASCGITVENTGMVVDSCLLDVLGAAGEWARVEPERLNLLPGSRAAARIVFEPPRGPDTAPGEVAFALRAVSTEDLDGSRIEEGVVRVGEFSDLSAALVPQTAAGRRAARFKLLVENRGNRTETVAVAAADPDLKLAFEARPDGFAAEPGTVTFVRLRAVPRRAFFKGPDKSLPFVATATAEHCEPVAVSGTMLEKQILPRWLLPVLGITALACALLLVFWFTLLKPAVQSAAQAGAQSAASQSPHPSPKASGKPAAPADAVTVQLASPTVVIGATDLATATGSFTDGSKGVLPGRIVWTTSDPAIATVSQAGVVTAHTAGAVTITATTAGTAAGGASPGGGSASGSGSGAHGASSDLSVLGAPTPGLTPAPPTATPAQPGVLSGSVQLNVVGPLTVSGTTLVQGALGKPYSQPLTASGGTGSYTWSVSAGTLPPGLTLSPATGAISGTPTALGQTSFTLHVADAGPPVQFATGKFTLSVVSALTPSTTALPGAVVGNPYSQTIKAVGGTPPYAWALSPGAGSLPPGLTLNQATGAITGTPTTTGVYSFTIKGTDAAMPGQSIAQPLSISIVNPLIFVTRTLPDAVTDTQYSQTPVVTGGTQPYDWSVSAGALPGGIVLNTATGALTGTPTTTGTFSFTLKVTDAGGTSLSAEQKFTMSTVSAFTVTTSSLPNAVTAGTYTPPVLAATGGTAPYVWQLTGTLPDGLVMSVDGHISGVPTRVGDFPFTVQATDSSSPPLSFSRSLSIAVVGSLAVDTRSLPDGVTGAAYSKALSASGGAKGYTWKLVSGPLPDGLALDSASGTISGTPTRTGVFPIAVRVEDSSTPPQTASVNLGVDVVNPLTFTLPALPNAIRGAGYAAAPPTASGGTGAYTWSISAGTSLPTGLQLDPVTGIISGTASVTDPPGMTTFTLTATDRNVPTLAASYPETIQVVANLEFTTSQLPDATVGTPYAADLSAFITGGTAPYTISAVSNVDGLSINSAGAVSGTPGGATTLKIDLTVTDSTKPVPLVGQFQLQLRVKPSALVVDWVTTQLRYVDFPSVFHSMQTVNSQPTTGIGPYTYSIVSGSLPSTSINGLSLNSSTGEISGAVSYCNSTFDFTVQVQSADGQTAAHDFSMVCNTTNGTIG